MESTVHEVILDYMELSENVKQVGYPVLRKVMKLYWYGLFKKTPESIVRKWVDVVDGVINYPETAERQGILGCYIIDANNDLKPLYEDTIKNIIPVPKTKCSCNSCNVSECMCPTIKDNINQVYVVIDGRTYINKTITRVLKSGKVVEEKLIWVPKYDASSLLIGVNQVTSQVTKCSIETLPCGCLKNTEENHAILLGCGCIDDLVIPHMRDKYPAMYNRYGYYKKDEDNKKIFIFNYDGKKSQLTQILLVFQSNGADMLVPEYALVALIALLDWGKKMYSPSYIVQDRLESKRNYFRHKNDMIKYLNPIPYELVTEINDVRKKLNNQIEIHPSLLPALEVVTEELCLENPEEMNNITNITYTTNVNEVRFLKVEVDGGDPDSPVSGLNTYQNNKLKGLGINSNNRLEITVDAQEMQNWGQNASFTLNKTTGIITFTQGYRFQPHTSLKVDLNQ